MSTEEADKADAALAELEAGMAALEAEVPSSLAVEASDGSGEVINIYLSPELVVPTTAP
jgi:hypothetical protein